MDDLIYYNLYEFNAKTYFTMIFGETYSKKSSKIE